ncbi:MAG: DUF2442 domain-containing protein [Planctomycetota bacterium]
MFHIITRATPEPPCRLRLAFADGTTDVVDFAPLQKRGGVFTKLGDPQFFAQVRIGERGRTIEWPGELDFCADALWMECHKNEAVSAPAATAAEPSGC